MTEKKDSSIVFTPVVPQNFYLLDDLTPKYENTPHYLLVKESIEELATLGSEKEEITLLRIDGLIEKVAQQINEKNENYDEVLVVGGDGDYAIRRIDQYLRDHFEKSLLATEPLTVHLTRIYNPPAAEGTSYFFDTGIERRTVQEEFAGLRSKLENKRVLIIDDVQFSGDTMIYITNNLPRSSSYDAALLLVADSKFRQRQEEIRRTIGDIFIGIAIKGEVPTETNLLNTKDLINDNASKRLIINKDGTREIKKVPFYLDGDDWMAAWFSGNPRRAFEICDKLYKTLNYN